MKNIFKFTKYTIILTIALVFLSMLYFSKPQSHPGYADYIDLIFVFILLPLMLLMWICNGLNFDIIFIIAILLTVMYQYCITCLIISVYYKLRKNNKEKS